VILLRWINRKYQLIFYFSIVSWIILAIVFGFYDLQISRYIANPNSIAGIIGRDFGEALGFGIIGISIAILIGKNFNKIEKQKIGILFPILSGSIYLIIGILFLSVKSIIDSSSMIIFSIIFLYLTWKKDWKKYKTFAWITFLVFIINVLLIIQIFKIAWGRVRFEDLAPDYSDYTPWFIPRGFTGNKSFPSGHTSTSFITLTLLLLISNLNFKKVYRFMISFIIIGWALFVAISRVLIGAHYASDVLFSAEISLLLTVLLANYLYKEKQD